MAKSYFRGFRQDSNFDGRIANGPGFLQSGGGWANFITGLGTFSRDKVMQGTFFDPIRITDPELAAMYHGNDLAARIVELRPREMFRRGYELVLPDPKGTFGQNANAELALEVEKYAAKLRCNELLRDACIFGRLFGGTLVIVGADDGQDVSKPLNEDRIKTVRFLNIVDRRFLFAHTYYGDPFAPKFGEVETYQVTNAFGDQQNSVVHESRVLRFDGAPVEILKKRMLAGWTLSVLQRPYDTLRAFDTSFQAVANLLVDAGQGKFKITDLMEQISADSTTLQQRLAIMDMQRSSARSLALDKENEDFERDNYSFGGIAETLTVMMQRLASAAEMPVTILFGREPSGLNATGEADFQHFYDTIATEQVNVMQPMLVRLYSLICKAKDSPTKGRIPGDEVKINWHALKEPNDAEKAELYSKMADADSKYVTAQVLLPEEVALSRFRGGKLHLETEIDVDARKKSMDNNLQMMLDQSQAPEVPNQPGELTPGEPANVSVRVPIGQGSSVEPNSGRTK